MTKEEANKKISENLEQIKALLNEAYGLANEYGLSFKTPIQKWGMGGNYNGKGRGEFERKEEGSGDGDWYYSNEGWQSSSERC